MVDSVTAEDAQSHSVEQIDTESKQLPVASPVHKHASQLRLTTTVAHVT